MAHAARKKKTTITARSFKTSSMPLAMSAMNSFSKSRLHAALAVVHVGNHHQDAVRLVVLPAHPFEGLALVGPIALVTLFATRSAVRLDDRLTLQLGLLLIQGVDLGGQDPDVLRELAHFCVHGGYVSPDAPL